MTPKTKPPDAFSPGETPTFEASARESLRDSQLRRNLGKATQTIRRKRTVAVEEMPDWEELREAGRALKERTLRHLDTYLLQLEESVTRAGGVVHWAGDADEANRIIAGIAKEKGAEEVAGSNPNRFRTRGSIEPESVPHITMPTSEIATVSPISGQCGP